MHDATFNYPVAKDPPRLYLLPPLVPARRTLSPRIGYAVAALVVGLGLFASVTPSPLYRTYSVLWHFSPLTLTLIYATYAFGVLASLLLVGGVSDDVGRRLRHGRHLLVRALGALYPPFVVLVIVATGNHFFLDAVAGALVAALGAALAALLTRRPSSRW